MPSAVLNYLVGSIYSPKKIVDSIASTIVVIYINVLYHYTNSSILCFKILQLNCINWLMKAIIFSLLGWMMLPVMDGFAKYLSSDFQFYKLLGQDIFLLLLLLCL